MNNKKTRFFCENCETEVKPNAKFCSKCGKFFVSVRCPKCGKCGPQSIFVKGCPRCGYATVNSSKNDAMQSKHKNKYSNDPLPSWFYLILIVALGILLICLLF